MFMNYSCSDTILTYMVDPKILQIVDDISKSKSLKLKTADSETDLIAVPNLFIITDINKLTDETMMVPVYRTDIVAN